MDADRSGPAVRVTIDDVARAAGVSRQTVSRAMNGKSEISAATRRRVLATIEELDYRPSVFARGMRTQRAGTLALTLSDIANPFFPAVARGVFDAAAARGFTVVVYNTDADAARELAATRDIVERGADGVIGFFEALDDAALVALGRRVPVVVADRRAPDDRTPDTRTPDGRTPDGRAPDGRAPDGRAPAPTVASVTSDFVGGTRAAVAHLVARGHRRLGMVDGAVLSKPDRRRAFVAALAEQGVPDAAGYVVAGPPTLTGGGSALAGLLDAHPDTTAVFAFNDLMALGAVRELHARGRDVPGDVAVVGYDDVAFSALVDPPLTTVHTDKYELGRTLVDVLGGVLTDPPQVEHRVLPASLVVRAST